MVVVESFGGRGAWPVAAAITVVVGCGSNGSTAPGAPDAGRPAVDATTLADARRAEGGPGQTRDARAEAAAARPDAGHPADATNATDAGAVPCTGSAGDAGACYSIVCTTTTHTLVENEDRLLADLARRKCTDTCTLWAALNESERYIFLMVTAYLGSPSSLIYPPGMANTETALDHAVTLYTINGSKAGQGELDNGLGGNDYNRVYLGFDPLAQCVMRNFTIANPTHETGYNEWVKSDDVAGPHAPFTQRDMIAWYKALTDLQTQGPQFHFWHEDSDFTQSGLNLRLGVCGVTDPSISEMTIAFDGVHDSDPLAKYPKDGKCDGGYGWQIVDDFAGVTQDWSYAPTGCSATPPVNTSTTGGGTFAGMGPSLLDGSTCSDPALGDAASCH